MWQSLLVYNIAVKATMRVQSVPVTQEHYAAKLPVAHYL